ncbi:phage integrase [Vibrio sp. VB16]|uniref:phage integrase n=1 Tax=Vibrio sp. VB16 TaxID=2785746 RepID=UPI0018A0CD0D|nr:tyrosine-type recombinase/integrase [Vibrio sp. VB16]UGA55308.1 tyrosine-type recombinase/integrase [Vibrio sp. VB16]
MIEKDASGFYFFVEEPKRSFRLERDALQYAKRLQLQAERDSDKIQDNRRLEELITLWYRLHGKTLRDHVRLRKLLYRLSDQLGNPVARQFTSELFAEYRERRAQDVSTTTVNREHAYLRAVFNELSRLGVIDYDNPLKLIRQFREREGELRFLSHEEISKLLDTCDLSTNKSLIYVVKICLATGARWSEAENLKMSQVANGRITYLNTKSGKNRSIPINDSLLNELQALGRSGDERLFLSSLSAFRKAVQKAKISLPRGQMSHVLRHTFASHFVMGGGNIVVLKDILGHSEITTTMRYSHLAPSHLTDAVRLNPLNQHM